MGIRFSGASFTLSKTAREPCEQQVEDTIMARWTTANIPDQSGRTVVVTGTGGLGFEDALALAKANATVIVAGRNRAKGDEAVARIQAAEPSADVQFEDLDLASLASVARFGDRLKHSRDRLDVLINNAGIMVPPRRMETEDGFESQLGVNYLGHFALTAHLMPLLRRGRDARVVSLSSVAARQGAIDFDDLNAERRYRPMPVYAQSKLACLMFALELQRRCEAAGWPVISMAAHPGISRTELLNNAPGRNSFQSWARNNLTFLFQPADRGALPTLFAATSPSARAGGYYGPNGMGEVRGWPAPARLPSAAEDRETARRLWEVSQQLTGLKIG
jgi:NAD(P)-dependent dehydrogenase (short-subunit alcohol dehydrogenase family)